MVGWSSGPQDLRSCLLLPVHGLSLNLAVSLMAHLDGYRILTVRRMVRLRLRPTHTFAGLHRIGGPQADRVNERVSSCDPAR